MAICVCQRTVSPLCRFLLGQKKAGHLLTGLAKGTAAGAKNPAAQNVFIMETRKMIAFFPTQKNYINGV